jgi:hypothetical protein
MPRFLSTLILLTWTLSISGQTTFRVEENALYPDFKLSVGENVFYPDITINIGEGVFNADFRVGVTSNRSQADFVITTSAYADYTVQAGENVFYPDLRIKAGKNAFYPDITIEIVKSGTVDYIVFTEKDFITLRDLTVALLPAINYHTDFEHKELNDWLER